MTKKKKAEENLIPELMVDKNPITPKIIQKLRDYKPE